MNPLKREATEPLLPTRSNKQARIHAVGSEPSNSSVLEDGGLLSRWLSVGQLAFGLSVETVYHIMDKSVHVRTESKSQDISTQNELNPPSRQSDSSFKTPDDQQNPVLVHSTTPEPTPCPSRGRRQFTSPERPRGFTPSPSKPTELPKQDRTRRHIFQPKPEPSNMSSSSPFPIQQSDTPFHGPATYENRWKQLSNNFQKGPTTNNLHREHSTTSIGLSQLMPRLNDLHLESQSEKRDIASDRLTSSDSGTVSRMLSPEDYLSHPQIRAALSRAPVRKSDRYHNAGTRRKNRDREHIYARVVRHKANIAAEKQRNRKELMLQLFEVKRRAGQGFTSGLKDLEGLMEYRMKLARLGEDSSSTLSSDHGSRLLGRPPFVAAHVPVDLPADDDISFLQSTLEKARRTLESPKPPKPYVPTFEQLRVSHRAKDDEIERRLRPSVTLPSKLPPQDELKVDAILKRQGVVSKFAREQVSEQDVSRLKPSQWLNDEIINFYGAMIMARADECKENPGAATGKGKKKPLNAHYFSTFFWHKLTKEGYDKGRLAKWTKKLDIFSKDIILIPVNHSNAHWTAAAINFRQKRIESYDSMNMAKDEVFKHLRSYLDAEYRNKKKKPFNFGGWENWAPEEDTPQQENGYDCGVFTCQFLEALSRGEDSFPFCQKDMPYLRRRMIWEIGHATLRDDY